MTTSPSVEKTLDAESLLEALGAHKLPPDPAFDALALLAARVLDAPAALVTLRTGEREWIKASTGLDLGHGQREGALLTDQPPGFDFIIELADLAESTAQLNARLAALLPGVRYYASAPIRVADVTIGTVALLDVTPRSLNSKRRQTLTALASMGSRLITTHKGELSNPVRDIVEESESNFALFDSMVDEVQRILLAERHQLASVIEATEVATWEYCIPDGTVDINDRWAGLIGYSRAELEPVSIDSFTARVHPDDIPMLEQALATHLDGDARDYECEFRMQHRDGRWIWLLTRGRVLDRAEDGSARRMFGVHLDIRQRKLQEESLTRMSSLLESTGSLARVGGWELNLEAQELLWTTETKRIHGLPPDYEPELETAINFYAPEARDQIRGALEHAVATGESWSLEVPLIRADGERIWVHALGRATLNSDGTTRLYGAFQDITEHRALLNEISESRELLRVTIESIGDGVITTDREGRITGLNPVAERLTGWSPETARDLPVDDVFKAIGEQDRQPVANPITRCLAERRVVKLSADAILVARDGREHGVEDSAAPILSEDGQLLGAVMVFHDVTEQRRLSGEMRYRAKHDLLTGLTNRTEFEDTLDALLASRDPGPAQHSVLFIDLDNFKIVNDSCGHAVGDELLQRVATLFKDTVRAGDTVARLGGDEFGMILESCPPERARSIAEGVCERIREFRFLHGEERFRIGASIGVVHVNREWPSVTAVLQAADTACYAAKAAGRDRIHVYEDSDSVILNQRSETRWVTQIEAALDQDRFVLHRQPIAGAEHGAGHEARYELLLRMVGADGELIPPGAFLPAAERFHLIGRIDRWVLLETIKLLGEPSLGKAMLFVNLSGRSVGDRMFQDFVLGLLRSHPPDLCSRLVLELTETAVISNLVEVRDFLNEIQELGVSIALDDFGSGMASFRYLQSLPLNYLKIDGQFISSLLDDDLALATVQSFIDVARVIDVPTVAEHVETETLATTLTSMGVQFLQGYHLGKPEPARDA